MGFNLVGTSSVFTLGQNLNLSSYFQAGGHITDGSGILTVGKALILSGTLTAFVDLIVTNQLDWRGGIA